MANLTQGRAISKKTLMLAQAGVLAAIMLIFHFTGIGYFKFGIFEMTIMMVPVIIGAITVGPLAGAALGAIFGTSVVLLPGTAPLMAINPIAVIVLCVVVRGLGLGALSGVMFRLFQKIDKNKVWSFEATGLITALLNTVITLAGLVIIFGSNPDFNVEGLTSSALFTALIAGVGVQAVFEALICTVVAGIIAKAVMTYLNKTSK